MKEQELCSGQPSRSPLFACTLRNSPPRLYSLRLSLQVFGSRWGRRLHSGAKALALGSRRVLSSPSSVRVFARSPVGGVISDWSMDLPYLFRLEFSRLRLCDLDSRRQVSSRSSADRASARAFSPLPPSNPGFITIRIHLAANRARAGSRWLVAPRSSGSLRFCDIRRRLNSPRSISSRILARKLLRCKNREAPENPLRLLFLFIHW